MRPEKKYILQEFETELKDANPIVLTGFRGLEVNSVNRLRENLRQVEAMYKVVKKRIFLKALNNMGYTGIKPESIEGPLAVAYGGKDIVEVIKVIVNFAKDNPNSFQVKCGIVDKNILDGKGLDTLSKLPSRTVLIVQVVSGMAAPLTNFLFGLQNIIQKLVLVLDGIAKKKEGQE